MKSRRRFLSRALALFCIVMMVCVFAVPLHASADTKSYSVKSADFDITFSENGDAAITESWTVTYTSGSFTRFYKDIFDPGNQLEYFPKVTVLGAHINGEEATAANSIDRVDYHYYFEKSSKQMFTIHWFKAVQNETVNYDITYEIPNAVKLNQDDHALYCYRLIGKNFPKTVSEVTATVHLPENMETYSVQTSTGNFSVEGDTVSCTAYSVSGMYKLRLDMEADSFGSLGRVIDVEIPDGYSDDETSSRSGNGGSGNTHHSSRQSDEDPFFGYIMTILGGFSVLLIIVNLIKGILTVAKARTMYKHNPDVFLEASERIEESGMPYLWYGFSKISGRSCSRYPFYAEILDLCRLGYLTITPDDLFINNFDDSNLTDTYRRDMDREFISLLTAHFPLRKDWTSRGAISFDKLKGTEATDVKFLSELNSWTKRYEDRLGKSQLYKELKRKKVFQRSRREFELWRKYAVYIPALPKVDPESCFGVLERTGTVDAYTVMLLFQWLLNAGNRPVDTGSGSYYFFDYYERSRRVRIDDDDDDGGSHHSSSGSSCASCSSCSSCSGCGGGGAD